MNKNHSYNRLKIHLKMSSDIIKCCASILEIFNLWQVTAQSFLIKSVAMLL